MTSKFMYAIALAAVASLHSTSVSAQITSITETEVPTTAPDPLLSSATAATATVTAECWLSTIIAGESAGFPIAPSTASSVNGVVCLVDYTHDGGVIGEYITITDAITFSSPTSAASVSGATTSSSSNRAIKVLMPALIGSIGGAFLLILATLYFLRLRTRRRTQASRANRWVTRNSGSWAMKEQKPREANMQTNSFVADNA